MTPEEKAAKNKQYRLEHKEELAAKQSIRRIAKYHADIEASREADRARYAADPRRRESAVASHRRRVAEDPEKFFLDHRARQMMKHFGKTLEDYDEQLQAQGGVCLICKEPPGVLTKKGRIRSFAWDHDHACCPGLVSCGECIRGLLCTSCNLTVGRLEAGNYTKQINYILEWNDRQD